MRKRRESGEVFGLAFLDIIACGFGAIVVLLLISGPALVESGAPASPSTEQQKIEVARAVARLRARQERLEAQLSVGPSALEAVEPDDAPQDAVRRAQQELAKLEAGNRGLERAKASRERAEIRARSLTEERDAEVGGIPVDSEYVIFIVDTSGSMRNIWDQVLATMDNVLDIHPRVEGFQVMNDNGRYLVSSYAGRWIRDTPRRRKSILQAMKRWTSVSNSSPVEGLKAALRTYGGDSRKKIAIYIFGDDYSLGTAYDQVLGALQQLNTDRVTGKRKVRVHAVGFLSGGHSANYATLMREVTRQNNGAFLALPANAPPGR